MSNSFTLAEKKYIILESGLWSNTFIFIFFQTLRKPVGVAA